MDPRKEAAEIAAPVNAPPSRETLGARTVREQLPAHSRGQRGQHLLRRHSEAEIMAGPDEVAVEVVARIAWAADIGTVGVLAAMLALAGGGHVSVLDEHSVAVPVLQLVRGPTLWFVQMAVTSGQILI